MAAVSRRARASPAAAEEEEPALDVEAQAPGQECPNPATQPAVPPAQTKGHRSRDCPPPRKCLWLAGGAGVPSGSQRKEARPGPGEVLRVTPDVAGEPGKCLVDVGAMYSVLT